jgi:hypothetical protein
VLGDGKPTMILYGNWERGNWLVTYFAGVLNRNVGVTTPTFFPIYHLGPIMGSADISFNKLRMAHDVKLERFIIAGGVRHLRVIVSDPGLDATLRSFAAAHPDLGMTVMYMPQLSAS